MTGQRPSPRGRGDPWRGGRPEPGGGSTGPIGHGGPEVEELPGQLVVRRRGPRIGPSVALAGVAVVVLLASGLGLLGGRTQPTGRSPGASDLAAGLPTTTSTPAVPLRTPAVTPLEPCGADPERLPRIYLDVDGASRSGFVHRDLANPSPTPAGIGLDGFPIPPVEIPAGAETEIWIERDACAVAWHVHLAAENGSLLPIAIRENPGLDAGFVSQNHLGLSFGDNVGLAGAFVLEADLDFASGLRAIARWPIRFLPVVRPQPVIRIVETAALVPTVEGCDVVLTLRNGEEIRSGCDRDLSLPAPPPTKVRTGAPLSLDIDGWSVTDLAVNCGTQSDRVFLAVDVPDCVPEPDGTIFYAPTPGDWTLAVAACAIGVTQFASNRICGTWFASIDTR